MFPLLRILFVVIVLLWAYCFWKERRSGDPYWHRVRNWVLRFAIALVVIMAIGLFIERLLS